MSEEDSRHTSKPHPPTNEEERMSHTLQFEPTTGISLLGEGLDAIIARLPGREVPDIDAAARMDRYHDALATTGARSATEIDELAAAGQKIIERLRAYWKHTDKRGRFLLKGKRK